MRIRGLCKLPDGETGYGGKLGNALVQRVMLSKSLIQLPSDGWGCSPSLLVVWPKAIKAWSLQEAMVVLLAL